MSYGPNNGTVPFTGYTPTLGSGAADVAATSGAVHSDRLTQHDRAVSFLMRTPGARKTRELLLTLLGATAGSAALETRKQRTATQQQDDAQGLGGNVDITTADVVNRNTTSDDTTQITGMLSRQPWPTAYVEDASGNGGGGRSA